MSGDLASEYQKQAGKSLGVQDGEREESTIMEGFRYRINNIYPTLAPGKALTDFPIIPPGMMAIWRDEDSQFNF